MMGDEEEKEGQGRRTRRRESVACDYCNEEVAILYCRADSAKLCVRCDQHVHSANPLSLKHIRSQICYNCHSQPVSFLCVSDHLLLCQDCDEDAHSSTHLVHNRIPVDGFSGCPSPSQLASHLGLHDFKKLVHRHNNINSHPHFDTTINKYHYDDQDVDDQFMVPSTKGLPQFTTDTISSACGNQKHVIRKQLIHLFNTQQQHEHFQIHHQEEEEETQQRGRFMTRANDNDDEEEDSSHSLLLTQSLHSQQLPFTSLLMQQQVSTGASQLDVADQGGFQQPEAGQMLWNTHPSDQGTQAFSLYFQLYSSYLLEPTTICCF